MPKLTNWKVKLLLLFLVCLSVLLLNLLSGNLAAVTRNYLNSDFCISDTLFELIFPVTKFYYKNAFLNNFTIAFDSFLIDVTMLYFLFRVVAFGKSTILLIYLFLFYPFRFMSLYVGGHWPLPDYQTFHYPGIPSILVPYDQTNDFYFSGHTGLTTCLLFMFLLHFHDDEDYEKEMEKVSDEVSVVTTSTTQQLLPTETVSKKRSKMTMWHKVFLGYGVFILLITLYMLTVTRGHYFNDLLIGFLVALIGVYYGTKFRFTISFWILWGYANLFDFVICTRYQQKGKEKGELPFEKEGVQSV